MTTAIVSNIQKYSIHDGPGIRSTVFLKGCPLYCAWCHNPETQVFKPEIVWYKEKCIGCISSVKACPHQALKASKQDIVIDIERCTRCGKCTDVCPSLAMEKLGKKMTVEQVLTEVSKDAIFYQQSRGGVTLPYHKMAEAKYHRLHLPYTISRIGEPRSALRSLGICISDLPNLVFTDFLLYPFRLFSLLSPAGSCFL